MLQLLQVNMRERDDRGTVASTNRSLSGQALDAGAELYPVAPARAVNNLTEVSSDCVIIAG